MRRLFPTVLAVSALALATAAMAADLRGPAPPPAPAPALLPESAPFFVKLGFGGLFMSEKADIKVAGAPYPGANIKIKPQYTAMFELGYNFTPNWSVAFAGGLPPLAKVDAAGSIRPFGRLGNVRYGPVALLGQYHFEFGAFRPYIGAGPALMVVLNNYDRFLTGLDMRNALGFAGQAGVDVMVTDRFGVYLDAKKVYLRSTAVGSIGPAPVKAKVTLDPWIFSTGVVARF